MAREADGVKLLSWGEVTRERVPISGRPQVGDTVHLVCRVTGVRERQDGEDGDGLVATLEPEGVSG
jgi:hypothetical protein